MAWYKAISIIDTEREWFDMGSYRYPITWRIQEDSPTWMDLASYVCLFRDNERSVVWGRSDSDDPLIVSMSPTRYIFCVVDRCDEY